MQNIGLLIEFNEGCVKEAALGMATVARRENHQLVALLVDAPDGDVKSVLEAYGVARIVHIRTSNPRWNPADQTSAVMAAMHKFDINHLIGLTSPTGREILPRLAARLDAPLIMDCIDIDFENHRVKTSQYSGKTIATIAMTGRHMIYGLRPNVIASRKERVDAQVIEFPFCAEKSVSYQVLETLTDGNKGAQYLAEADIIISGGRGLKSAENFKLLTDCARHMGASVGASRVAVDNGWVPYAMQVGQTGVKVNPKVYIAVGISGSIQHFAGMKTSQMIIAINSDKNAAIMANCNYYAVGDLFEILPELEKALSAL
jgi:electron transfer flavoprotein alpha subunit